MAAYARMLLNAGQGPGSPLLSPEWFDRLAHRHVATGKGGTGEMAYGYGISVTMREGRAHLDHGGGVPGFVAHLNVDRNTGVGVVTLSTTPHVPGISWELLRAWRAAYLGRGAVSFSPPKPRATTTTGEEDGGRAAAQLPPSLQTYVGHFRSHNVWATNFRVVPRGSALWLVWPDGRGQRLVPCDGAGGNNGEFFVGDPPTPERVRFDQVAGGAALRAVFSVTDYYRFFTP